MSSVADLKAAHNPKIHRFKELGTGLKVGRVIGDRVLVKTIIDETKLDEVEKKGLLYIPEGKKAEYTPLPSKGVVIAVGDGVPYVFWIWYVFYFLLFWLNSDVHRVLKEGDMILFGKYTGTDFRCEEQDFRIIPREETLCTLVDTDGSIVQVEVENPL